MMNINWKIRFKNPMFWVQVIISIFTPILAYMGLTVQDLTSWGTILSALNLAVTNPYVLVLVLISLYNAVIDPTTTGITDSAKALTYDEPNSLK